MSEARAQQQARAAAQRRPDGTRGVVARGAWQRLLRGRDKGDFTAAMGLLEAWLLDPDEERWEQLGQHDPDWVLGKAVAPDRPASQRAAIGAFCARHGMAPDREPDRALFFIMTGQRAQHRALDLDGSLLAAAYRAADQLTRTALRAMLADAGDQDLIAVVAEAAWPGHGARLSAADTRFLTSQLAERGEWVELWRLVQDLPLAPAVAAIRLFTDWRPADESGRELFGLLARGSGELARARDAFAVPEVIRVDLERPVHAASFSPDGRLLALCVQDFIDTKPMSPRVDLVSDLSILVFQLPGGELVERHDHGRGAYARLLHLGDALLVARRTERDVRAPYTLLMFARGQEKTLYAHMTAMTVEPHRAGFVALEAAYGSCRLRFHATSGRLVNSVWPFRMGVRRVPNPPQLVASDPDSGRLAMDCDGLWILDADATSVLASPTDETRDRDLQVRAAAFLEPDRLVTTDSGHVRLLRLEGGRLETEASATLVRTALFDHPLAVTHRGEIAILDEGKLRYLDPESLGDVPAPRELAGAAAARLWGSHDRRLLAVGGMDHVQVVANTDASVAAVVSRPLADLVPADVGAVASALPEAAPGSAARSFLELLRDVLRQRFGAEVALGDSRAAPPSGPDDVALDSGSGSSTASPGEAGPRLSREGQE